MNTRQVHKLAVLGYYTNLAAVGFWLGLAVFQWNAAYCLAALAHMGLTLISHVLEQDFRPWS